MEQRRFEVDVVRCVSARCFVVRRVAHPAVFLVEFAARPPWFAELYSTVHLPVRATVALGEFDWDRKSFAAESI